MSKEKPFSHPRWTDPPKAKVVGYTESTKEEREEAKAFLDKKIREHQKIKRQNK